MVNYRMYLNWRKTLANPERFEIFMQNLNNRSNRYVVDYIEFCRHSCLGVDEALKMKEILMISDRLYDAYSPNYKASDLLLSATTAVSSCSSLDLDNVKSNVSNYFGRIALNKTKKSFVREILVCLTAAISRQNVNTLESKCLADALVIYDMRIRVPKYIFTDSDIRNLSMFTELGNEIKNGYLLCLSTEVHNEFTDSPQQRHGTTV